MGRLTQEEINADLFDEVKRLKQQLREKEARIARLEQSSSWVAELSEAYANGDTDAKAVYRAGLELGKVVNETPQQSLAHIQADAVLTFARTYDGNSEIMIYPAAVRKDSEAYAQQLRDKADGR